MEGNHSKSAFDDTQKQNQRAMGIFKHEVNCKVSTNELH